MLDHHVEKKKSEFKAEVSLLKKYSGWKKNASQNTN